MIIDLSDYLKCKPHICVSDNHHNYKNNFAFADDKINGFLFNIEVGRFIIEVIKHSQIFYLIIVWDYDNDSSIIEKDNINANNFKQELISCIEYCEKYEKLKVFS